MCYSTPTLPRNAVHSPAFLDALRALLRDWSLALFDPDSGGFRFNAETGPTVMSTTDVVWIRYAINDPEPGAPDCGKIVRYLLGRQDPRTGLVRHDPAPPGRKHGDGHAFWQTVRALRILGATIPRFPAWQAPLRSPAGLDEWFARFDWDRSAKPPRGNHHHEVLGLIPMVVSARDGELAEALFRNIEKQQNPSTGTWPRPKTEISRTFAYTCLHMAAGKLPKRPEGIVDDILRLQNPDGLWDEGLPQFRTMDSAYLLVRLPKRIRHREADAIAALEKLSAAMRRVFGENQPDILADTHRTLAVAHTFGLLQEAFPEEYPSERPYRFGWDELGMYDCGDAVFRDPENR